MSEMSKEPTEEHRRLVAFFQDLEKGQVDTLDAACKRVIELVTLMLGLAFATIAFGTDFPPSYLADGVTNRLLLILALVLYVGAMYAAWHGLRPRSYKLYRQNLTEMREELDKIIAIKSSYMQWAGGLFWGGSLVLLVLIALVLLGGY